MARDKLATQEKFSVPAIPRDEGETAITYVTRVFEEEAKQRSGSMDDIIDRILDANTVEEVYGGGNVVHAEAILTWPIRIEGYEPAKGDFGVFAVINASLPNGEEVLVTCGGARVLATLLKWRQMGAFPRVAAFDQVDITLDDGKPGTVIFLRPVEGNTVEGNKAKA